jgi:hypothetical protein
VESTEISANNNSHFSGNFSKYGRYEIENDLEFYLPATKIKFSKLGEGKFSYNRSNFQNEIIQKVIAVRPKGLEIEISPALPIHLPAYKTDFMFLRLATPLHIGKSASTEFNIAMPIEIGIYITDKETAYPIDYLFCPPSYSKYGLYGQPESGRLCKYAKISIDGNEKETPFAFGTMQLRIHNELHRGVSIGQIVFPITDHDIYYSDTAAVIDPLEVIVKERLGLDFLEMKNATRNLPKWSKASRDMPKTDFKFSMENGFDK